MYYDTTRYEHRRLPKAMSPGCTNAISVSKRSNSLRANSPGGSRPGATTCTRQKTERRPKRKRFVPKRLLLLSSEYWVVSRSPTGDDRNGTDWERESRKPSRETRVPHRSSVGAERSVPVRRRVTPPSPPTLKLFTVVFISRVRRSTDGQSPLDNTYG